MNNETHPRRMAQQRALLRALLRWTAWLALCLGMLFVVFTARNTVMEMLAPNWWRSFAGPPASAATLTNRVTLLDVLLYFVIGILLIVGVVWLEHYLRDGERKGDLPKRFVLALTVLAGAYLASQIAFAQQIAVTYWLRGLFFPYPLDYGEGPILDQVMRLAHFQPLYFTSQATNAPPYTIANYPPLFHLVQVPFAWVFGPAFWYGRVINLLSVVAGAAAIALIIHTLTENWIAGAIGGLTTLCMPQVVLWAPYVRVDQLAFGLSLWALWVVVRYSDRRAGLVGAAALMVAAAYTKQSYALSAPLAAFAWLLSQRQVRRAFLLVGMVGAAGVALFGLLTLVTGGSFFFNVITANTNPFRWEQVQNTFDDLKHRLPLMLIGSGLSVLIGLWGRTRPRTWVLVSAYLVGATVEAITIGKVGSSVNYLYELSAAFGLVAGSLIAWPWKNFRWASAILMALLATQIVSMAYWGIDEYTTRDIPKFRQQAEIDQMAQITRQAQGPVLADEYMGLIPLAGQSLYMQPFEYKQVAEAGIWDDRTVAGDISNKRFAVILIFRPATWDSFTERWTPLLRSAIDTNYEVTGLFAETEVYTPR